MTALSMTISRSFEGGIALRHVLVMGICGTGKSTLAASLADRLDRPWIEADDHHSEDAIARMARGEALTDEDRWGWLDRIADAALATGSPTVIACSALKSAYRARLADRLGPLDIVHLSGARALISERMAARRDHYMPVSLIDSQLAALQAPEGADVLTLDIAELPDRLVDAALDFATRPGRDAGAPKTSGRIE